MENKENTSVTQNYSNSSVKQFSNMQQTQDKRRLELERWLKEKRKNKSGTSNPNLKRTRTHTRTRVRSNQNQNKSSPLAERQHANRVRSRSREAAAQSYKKPSKRSTSSSAATVSTDRYNDAHNYQQQQSRREHNSSVPKPRERKAPQRRLTGRPQVPSQQTLNIAKQNSANAEQDDAPSKHLKEEVEDTSSTSFSSSFVNDPSNKNKTREELLMEWKRQKQRDEPKSSRIKRQQILARHPNGMFNNFRDDVEDARQMAKMKNYEGSSRKLKHIKTSYPTESVKSARYWVLRAKVEEKLGNFSDVVDLLEEAQHYNAKPEGAIKDYLKQFLVERVKETPMKRRLKRMVGEDVETSPSSSSLGEARKKLDFSESNTEKKSSPPDSSKNYSITHQESNVIHSQQQQQNIHANFYQQQQQPSYNQPAANSSYPNSQEQQPSQDHDNNEAEPEEPVEEKLDGEDEFLEEILFQEKMQSSRQQMERRQTAVHYSGLSPSHSQIGMSPMPNSRRSSTPARVVRVSNQQANLDEWYQRYEPTPELLNSYYQPESEQDEGPIFEYLQQYQETAQSPHRRRISSPISRSASPLSSNESIGADNPNGDDEAKDQSRNEINGYEQYSHQLSDSNEQEQSSSESESDWDQDNEDSEPSSGNRFEGFMSPGRRTSRDLRSPFGSRAVRTLMPSDDPDIGFSDSDSDSGSNNDSTSSSNIVMPLPATPTEKEQYGTDFVLTPVRRHSAASQDSQEIQNMLQKSNYTYSPAVKTQSRGTPRPEGKEGKRLSINSNSSQETENSPQEQVQSNELQIQNQEQPNRYQYVENEPESFGPQQNSDEPSTWNYQAHEDQPDYSRRSSESSSSSYASAEASPEDLIQHETSEQDDIKSCARRLSEEFSDNHEGNHEVFSSTERRTSESLPAQEARVQIQDPGRASLDFPDIGEEDENQPPSNQPLPQPSPSLPKQEQVWEWQQQYQQSEPQYQQQFMEQQQQQQYQQQSTFHGSYYPSYSASQYSDHQYPQEQQQSMEQQQHYQYQHSQQYSTHSNSYHPSSTTPSTPSTPNQNQRRFTRIRRRSTTPNSKQQPRQRRLSFYVPPEKVDLSHNSSDSSDSDSFLTNNNDESPQQQQQQQQQQQNDGTSNKGTPRNRKDIPPRRRSISYDDYGRADMLVAVDSKSRAQREDDVVTLTPVRRSRRRTTSLTPLRDYSRTHQIQMQANRDLKGNDEWDVAHY